MIEFDFGKTLDGASGRDELSLAARLQQGELLTVFGPSGSGKTTLLRMLAGLTRPDRGRLVVDGQVWFDSGRGIALPARQRSVGYVFQDYALFPNMSVRENLAFAASRQDGALVDELLALTDLTGLAHRRPDTLSGGQQQRVALARALARRPRLLLLDEPLSAIDAGMRRRLQDELQTLHQRYEVTTILVSHDLGEVFRLSNRVMRIGHGIAAQLGTPAEVFLQERMAGKFNLAGELLALRREDVVWIATLLVGGEIVNVMASDDEISGLRPGDRLVIAAKAFSPLLFRAD